jgi:hypothetical protein
LETRPSERRGSLAAALAGAAGHAAHDAMAVGGGYLGTVDLLDPMELLAQGKL